MNEEGIGLLLARASELRIKIATSIQRLNQTQINDINNNNNNNNEDIEDCESLFNISDAMHSLEAHLSSFQALQQQQWYEREAELAEIDHSRKKLLKQLKDYKGEDLEVIHEASAFASETVEENNNDLLLPPYPTRPFHALLPDNNGYQSARNNLQNGVTNGEAQKNLNESERNQLQSQHQEPPKGLRFFFYGAAKTFLTIVGVVSILGMAGFEPRLRKKGNEFKLGNFVLIEEKGEKKEIEKVACPPGKVLVMEGGEARCLVKERVEVPFKSVVATPDINYGCG